MNFPLQVHPKVANNVEETHVSQPTTRHKRENPPFSKTNPPTNSLSTL